MPELPEVTTLCTALDERLRGARIASVAMRSVAALKTFDPPVDALIGLEVAGCARHGKFIDLEVPPLHLVVHLARAGWIRFRDSAPVSRGSMRGPLVAVVTLEDGRSLHVTEQGTEKRLAMYVVRRLEDVPGIARLGTDALDGTLTVEALAAMLRDQHSTVKHSLADQSRIAGIGNAYSDEILHAARISPFRRASSLTPDEVAALHGAVRAVMTEAVEAARVLGPESLKQDKRGRMRVHGRTGEQCPVCGDTIRQVALASRSFQYCPTCQTGGKVYADRRMSRLLR
ncbi:MAG: Fpg/Nei family DNA glycosylase [Candidatus Dormibacteraeota bacterium]|nr:Fpg/Nei family DNA glycosylase [Candidatus Dormibacteraeota bacterium]